MGAPHGPQVFCCVSGDARVATEDNATAHLSRPLAGRRLATQRIDRPAVHYDRDAQRMTVRSRMRRAVCGGFMRRSTIAS